MVNQSGCLSFLTLSLAAGYGETSRQINDNLKKKKIKISYLVARRDVEKNWT